MQVARLNWCRTESEAELSGEESLDFGPTEDLHFLQSKMTFVIPARKIEIKVITRLGLKSQTPI